MIKKVCLYSSIVLLSSSALAGGFGIEFGQSPDAYGCVEHQNQPTYFTCNAVPSPHSAFESYIVQATEEHGICWIKGIGKDINDNRYGSSTKSKVDEISEVLSSIYGSATKRHDVIFPSALWDGAEEWLMAIYKEERFYGYSWENLSSVKPKLEQIYLMAKSTGSSKGYIALDYYATFHEECSSAAKQSESGSL